VSLRLRLLVAVGLIAIVALVVADFATYSALRSSLYQQVDQELAQQPHRLPGTNGFPCPSPNTRFDDQGNSGGGPGAVLQAPVETADRGPRWAGAAERSDAGGPCWVRGFHQARHLP